MICTICGAHKPDDGLSLCAECDAKRGIIQNGATSTETVCDGADNFETELKPCPFCGHEAEFPSGYCNDLNYARVDCTNCSAGTYYDSDREPDATMEELEKYALNDWNRRTGNADD